MMLFPAVLMNFPNLKVCLIGEWSIPTFRNDLLIVIKATLDPEVLEERLVYVASAGNLTLAINE